MKVCSRCGKSKSLDQFAKNSRSKDGHKAACKECVKKYRETNRDEILRKKNEHHSKNKDRINKDRRTHRAANLKEARQKQNDYYHKHGDHIRGRRKEYRKKPEIKKKIQARNQRYYNENRDKILAMNKTWAEANRDKLTEYYAEYYRDNQGRIRERKRQYIKDNRTKVQGQYRASVKKHLDRVDQLKDAPCSDCGQKFPPYCMDFDHRPGEEKFMSVAKMVGHFSMEMIEAEIEKCDLTCRICHRIRTANRRPSRRRKNPAREAVIRYVQLLKKKNLCTDCGQNFLPVAMDFDHTDDDKYGNISDMVRRASMKRLKAELAKCELVCANCHAIRTHTRDTHKLQKSRIV